MAVLSRFFAFESSLPSYRSRLVADHSPPSLAPNPHRNVTRLVVEGAPGVHPSRLPASDNDGGVPVDADVVLVAVCLCPVAFTGPERSEYLLFAYRYSSGIDLEIVRIHQTIESRDIELQMRKEPFAFREEDLLDRIHLTCLFFHGYPLPPTTARLLPRSAGEPRAVCPVPSREAA